METLAEKLKNYLEEKNITMAVLAKNCQIDRSTMFQYIHGTRPLKNRDHLDQIMNRLSLTLSEREELLELFEIEKIGYELFFRRRKIETFIRSLPTLSETSQEQIWKLEAVRAYEDTSSDKKTDVFPVYLSNRVDLFQTFFTFLCRAYEQKEKVEILMQPQKSSLLDLLMHPAFRNSGINVSHILCLEDFKNDRSGSNIDRYHVLIQYFLLLRQYEPSYFYGNTKERFGLSNPFPYFICTKSWALQISSDENTGILHTDPEIVKGFQSLFSRISSCCQPLGKVFGGLEHEILWYDSYLNPECFRNAIELCTGLCSTQFWDNRLIDTYLNPMLPKAQDLKEQLTQYCRKLYECKRSGRVRILLNPAYALEFIKTGKFKEYPDIFFTGPLKTTDRKIILKRILEACEEGWYQIGFLDENTFPLHYRWELCSNNDTVTIQYFHLEQFRTLFIEECGFVEEMHGYLESLWQSSECISGTDATALLRTWVTQYLN